MARSSGEHRLPVRLPHGERSPFGSIQRRVVLALGLIAFVALVAYADRGGYKDRVIRDDDLLRFDDPRAERLEVGDRIVCLCNPDTPG